MTMAHVLRSFNKWLFTDGVQAGTVAGVLAGAMRRVLVAGASGGLVLLYIWAGQFWTLYGGLAFRLLLVELPWLVLFIAVTMPPIGRSWPRWILAAVVGAIVPVCAYLAHDVFTLHLRRSPEIDDLATIRLLADFGGWPIVAASLVGTLALAGVAAAVLAWHRACARRFSRTVAVVAGQVFGVALLFAVYPAWNALLYFEIGHSTIDAAHHYGRLSSMVHRASRIPRNDQSMDAQLSRVAQVPDRFVPATAQPLLRTIHVVVLEGLADPRRLPGVRFQADPLPAELVQVLGTADLPHGRTPVFGGSTAQAEFELLTGAPALSRFGQFEFNALRGNPVPGLFAALRQCGFAVQTLVANEPYYFNSIPAYASLGLAPVEFLGRDSHLHDRKVKAVHDEDLLSAVMTRVRAQRAQDPQARIATYTLGYEGHFPYRRDRQRHPDVVAMTTTDGTAVDASTRDLVNLLHHRMKAVAAFISAALAEDPQAAIVLVGDHLPSAYRALNEQELHRSILLFIHNGALERLDDVPFHAVTERLWRVATGQPAATVDHNDWYLRIMAAGMGRLPTPVR